MKTKIIFTGIIGITLLAMAEPRVWTFRQGGTIEGDYFTSGTTAVVIRRGGTNCILPIANLSSNDLAYVAQKKAEHKKAQLDAEARQMRLAGMVEFSANLINSFPEKVRFNKGWMDASFSDLDHLAGRLADIDLGFDVTDSDGNYYNQCVVVKSLHGPNWPNDLGQGDSPNPLVNVISNLKHGDKVRFYGTVSDRGPLDMDSRELFFYVERIQIIETAAEKKAREQAAENP